MRLSAMGDVAMTVPVLRAFVDQYPEVKITVHLFQTILTEFPILLFLPMKRTAQRFFGLLRLFQDLKELEIDAFADLHNVLRSKVVRTLLP
jgi:ADP-heptose:LPS heptosyltransferase